MTVPVFDAVSGQTWSGSTGSFTHPCNASPAGIAIGIIHAALGLTAGGCTFDGVGLTQLHLSDRAWLGYLLLPNIGTKNVVFSKTGGTQWAYTFITFSYVKQVAPTVLNASSFYNHDYYGGGTVGANDVCLTGCNANNVSSFNTRSGGYTIRATWSWATNYIAGVDSKQGGGSCYYDWVSNQNAAGWALQLMEFLGGRQLQAAVIG